MDKIDIKILNCLKDNARLTASAISEKINLSVSAVIERILLIFIAYPLRSIFY